MRKKTIRNVINKAPAKTKAKMTDIAAMGPEPASQGDKFDPTTINMIRAYNWYNYYFEPKDARKWVVDYMKLANRVFKKADVENFAKVESKNVPLWLCVNARMLMEGCSMPEGTHAKTHTRIKELLKTVVVEKKKKTAVSNVTPLREYPLIADLDEILDQFYNSDFKYFDPQIYDLMKDKGYKPNDAMIAYRYYSGILLDLYENKEGHERLKRKNRSNYEKFLEAILADLKLYATNEKTVRKARKPRARKVKSATQLVEKVKFKAEDRKLKLASLHPEKIIGAGGVWLYNTKYKKLTRLVAAKGKKLSIKGMTIINLDPSQCVFKRMRHPDSIHEMLKGTPTALLREYRQLKTKEGAANGRLGAETMILKVLK